MAKWKRCSNCKEVLQYSSYRDFRDDEFITIEAKDNTKFKYSNRFFCSFECLRLFKQGNEMIRSFKRKEVS